MTDRPFAEVFALGSELTTGAKLDTNSRWLSAELAGLGIETRFHHTAADDLPAMLEELRAAAVRSDWVLVTGGLGPTADDLTREALAALAGAELVEDPASLAHVEACFARSGREMPPRNRVQALLPRGAEALPNPHGTAPGVWLRLPPGGAGGPTGCTVAALPGVPAEMRPMFRDSVVSRLSAGGLLIRTARINLFGAGESAVEERLGDLTARGRVPEVGITAHEATITLRIVARGPDPAAIERQFAAVRRVVDERVGDLVFGTEDETLAGVVLRELRAAGRTLAVAEVGTGGRLSDWLAAEDDPADPAFLGGVLAPTAERLAGLLGCRGTDAGTLAAAVRDRAGATEGLFVPSAGGSDGPSILGVAAAAGTATREYHPAGDAAIARSRLGKWALGSLLSELDARFWRGPAPPR